MIPTRITVIAHKSPWSHNVQFLLTQSNIISPDGKIIVAQIIEWKEVNAGRISDPSFELDHDKAQELCDNLYALGVRPTEGKNSVGQLEAMKYHLEDMRKLALDNQTIITDFARKHR